MAFIDPVRTSSLAAQVANQGRPSLVPTKFPIQPQPQIMASGELSSPEMFAKVRSAATKLRNSLVEIAFYGWKLRQRQAWQELGFVDEDAAREDLGLSQSMWGTYMILGERLEGLTMDQMSTVTVEAARLLTRIHPNVWAEYAWLQEARALPMRKFALLVEQRNQQASPKALVEPRVIMDIKVPVTQKQRLDDRMQVLRKQQNLTTNAATLDYALGAAEREAQLRAEIAALQQQVTSLAELWPANQPWSANVGNESPEEQAERIATGQAPLTTAAHHTQDLTTKIRQSLEAINAVYAQKV